MKLKLAQTQSDFFRVVRIRTAVFVEEQHVDIKIEQDAQDDTALHWLVEDDDGQAIACCRGLAEGDVLQIGRVAVLKPVRGRHVGRFLMLGLEQDPALKPFSRLRVHAQIQVEGFYASLGYRTVSAPFEEAGILHVTMEKQQ